MRVYACVGEAEGAEGGVAPHLAAGERGAAVVLGEDLSAAWAAERDQVFNLHPSPWRPRKRPTTCVSIFVWVSRARHEQVSSDRFGLCKIAIQ